MKISIFAAALALAVLVSGQAFALDAADPAAPAAKATPAPTTAPAAPNLDAAARAAKSAECIRQADAIGLHGSKRKQFKRDCKTGKEAK